MDNLNKLIEIFSHFPGIGPRQARRFAYYLLSKPQSFIKDFSRLIEEVKKSTTQCGQCQRLFMDTYGNQTTRSDSHICSICGDTTRDHSTLMIVARDSDFESIERSGAYRGLYFILGGTVPVLDKEPEKRIRLKILLENITEMKSTPTEIILSMNTTPDGEHTTNIVREALMKITKDELIPTKLTVLGRGLSTGAELEYVDGDTIKSALKNRA
ncbi:MAG: toprim domain-containing protein [Candidatus Taylorbacteria bacterium]